MIRRITRPANDDIAIWVRYVGTPGGGCYQWHAHDASPHDRDGDLDESIKPQGKFRCAGPINTFRNAQDAYKDACALFDAVGE